MNSLGTVIVDFFPAGSGLQLWQGDGQTFTQVAPRTASLCSSINDLNETAYMVPSADNTITSLVRNTNGTLSTLASTDAYPFLYSPTTYLPSLSNSGSAVFLAQGQPAGAGIYVGPALSVVVNNVSNPEIQGYSTASMNDNLVVAFIAFNALSSRWGVYRGSAVPLIEDGSTVSGGTVLLSLTRPVINNFGTVAFTGSLNGTGGVYTTVDGNSLTLVGTSPVDRLSINGSGSVAYRRPLSGGAGSGIFIGRPGLIDQRVIGQGDPLDGSTVINAYVWEEGLNDQDQVAFVAQLDDGRWGVYRADPVNHPPVATNGAASVTTGASVSGVLNATDADSDALTYSIVTNGTKGTATITDMATGSYVYVANAGSIGTDTFTFKANDGSADSNTATIALTITSSSCAANITATIEVSGQGPKVNKKTGRYMQSVTLKNSGGAVAGPISLVLDNLSANASLFNASGTTACVTPSGRPYVNVDVRNNGVFATRERAVVTLEFTNPSGEAITYTPLVLAGANR
jgi:hypothetical protein